MLPTRRRGPPRQKREVVGGEEAMFSNMFKAKRFLSETEKSTCFYKNKKRHGLTVYIEITVRKSLSSGSPKSAGTNDPRNDEDEAKLEETFRRRGLQITCTVNRARLVFKSTGALMCHRPVDELVLSHRRR